MPKVSKPLRHKGANAEGLPWISMRQPRGKWKLTLPLAESRLGTRPVTGTLSCPRRLPHQPCAQSQQRGHAGKYAWDMWDTSKNRLALLRGDGGKVKMDGLTIRTGPERKPDHLKNQPTPALLSAPIRGFARAKCTFFFEGPLG